MALLEILVGVIYASPFTAFFSLTLALLAARSLYRIYFHPLAHIPGPLLAKSTSLWLHYHTWAGDEASTIYALHRAYGPILRVSPNQVDIGDADAIPAIYVSGGGFPKSPCYANFDIDGHKTIFSTIDVEYRTPRAKAVAPLFSTASIRANSAALYGCVDRMVARMQEDAASGRSVNVLNLTRSLAVDAVSTHLFQMNYNGTDEKTERLSVSAFVDAFVAVGRFFYMPNFTFTWLEWGIEKVMPCEHAASSMEVVDKFVCNLVDQTTTSDTNYPGRLMALGLERTEIISQCKDLIFAGTDSTGMNMATICRYLAIHQDKLERLRKELENNTKSNTSVEVQALPYLSAVIRESLRLSMANPSRLPHRVPVGGWSFKNVHFPANTDVGCAAYELHLNPIVFPDPTAFIPERWLDEDSVEDTHATTMMKEKGKEKERMNKYWFAFGAGSRACIARNLAMTELYMGTERVVESGVLRGARAGAEKVEIFEWFNSSVKGEKIELVWN